MTLPEPLDLDFVVVLLPRDCPRTRALPRVDVGGTEESGVPPRFHVDCPAGLDEADGVGAELPCILVVVPIDDRGLLLPLAEVDVALPFPLTLAATTEERLSDRSGSLTATAA